MTYVFRPLLKGKRFQENKQTILLAIILQTFWKDTIHLIILLTFNNIITFKSITHSQGYVRHFSNTY